MDCLEAMREMPDNAFDLAVVDPPYGAGFTGGGGCQGWFSKYHQDPSQIGNEEHRNLRGRFDRYNSSQISNVERGGPPQYNRFGSPGSRFEKCKRSPDGRDTGGEVRKKIIAWDVAPEKEYFDELFRVSRNQIIWGGNYFSLPPTRCFLIWRKLTISETFTMAMAEYAWTSFNSNAKVFECAPQGRPGEKRFHPCLPPNELVFMGGKWKPIKDVKVGDYNDFGRVVAISTHEAERLIEIYADGNKTVATWNHPFLVLRNNSIFWIQAEKIVKGDKLLCLKNTPRQKKDIYGTEKTKMEGSEWNTLSFGKRISAQFQRVCKSTTKTLTKQTIALKTSSLSVPLNINGYTKVADLKTEFGISGAFAAACSSLLRKITGTLTRRPDGSPRRFVGHATSKKYATTAEFVLQTVGSARSIETKTPVINLTIDGVPAFETAVGVSHNTQKPVELYEWIYRLFAKPGDKILDTHLGSGSSRIAAYNSGLDFIGYEIDPVYFKAEEDRFQKHISQRSIFDADYDEIKQETMF